MCKVQDMAVDVFFHAEKMVEFTLSGLTGD
jgi:hypothetical protein